MVTDSEIQNVSELYVDDAKVSESECMLDFIHLLELDPPLDIQFYFERGTPPLYSRNKDDEQNNAKYKFFPDEDIEVTGIIKHEDKYIIYFAGAPTQLSNIEITLMGNLMGTSDKIKNAINKIVGMEPGEDEEYEVKEEFQGGEDFDIEFGDMETGEFNSDISELRIDKIEISKFDDNEERKDVIQNTFNNVSNVEIRRRIIDLFADKDMTFDVLGQGLSLPKKLTPTMLRNRFLNNASLISRLFKFKDRTTKEIMLSTFLTRNGVMILTGIPGTGKTLFTTLGTLLFSNSYGFSDVEFVPQRMTSGDTQGNKSKFIDITRGDVSGQTKKPAEKEMKYGKWLEVPNMSHTISTRFKPKADLKYDDWDEPVEGVPYGPIKTQKFSPDMTIDYRREWEDKRFDEHMDSFTGEFYRKDILRKTQMYEIKYEPDSIQIFPRREEGFKFISDLEYDIARYPDTGERVRWENEIKTIIDNPNILIENERDDKKFEQIIIYNKKEMFEDEHMPDSDSILYKAMADVDNENDRDIFGEQVTVTEFKNYAKRYKELRDMLVRLVREKGAIDAVKNGYVKNNARYTWKSGTRSYHDNITNCNHIHYIKDARNEDEILEEMISELGIAKIDESKMAAEVIYGSKISLLQRKDDRGKDMQIYDFKPIPRPVVTQPGKFLNEFNRASPSVEDAILGLIEEKMVESEGETFRSPDFIMIWDMNPHKGALDLATNDRADINVYLPGTHLGMKQSLIDEIFGEGKGESLRNIVLKKIVRSIKRLIGSSMPELKNFLNTGVINDEFYLPLRFKHLKQIWDIIDHEVTIPERVRMYASLLTTTASQLWAFHSDEITPETYPIDDRPLVASGGEGGNRSNIIPQNYEREHYKTDTKITNDSNLKPVDYSLITWVDMYVGAKERQRSDISGSKPGPGIDMRPIRNKDPEKEPQIPAGIERALAQRFVNSMLKYAKALSWLRRGSGPISEKEILDLFPHVLSHRLSNSPNEEGFNIFGVADWVQEMYPNIEDYVRYGIIERYWLRDDKGSFANASLDYFSNLTQAYKNDFRKTYMTKDELFNSKGYMAGKPGNAIVDDDMLPKNDMMRINIELASRYLLKTSDDYVNILTAMESTIRTIKSGNYFKIPEDDEVMDIYEALKNTLDMLYLTTEDYDNINREIENIFDVFDASKKIYNKLVTPISLASDRIILDDLKDYIVANIYEDDGKRAYEKLMKIIAGKKEAVTVDYEFIMHYGAPLDVEDRVLYKDYLNDHNIIEPLTNGNYGFKYKKYKGSTVHIDLKTDDNGVLTTDGHIRFKPRFINDIHTWKGVTGSFGGSKLGKINKNISLLSYHKFMEKNASGNLDDFKQAFFEFIKDNII